MIPKKVLALSVAGVEGLNTAMDDGCEEISGSFSIRYVSKDGKR